MHQCKDLIVMDHMKEVLNEEIPPWERLDLAFDPL